MNVPDYVSPIVAYRVWVLGRSGLMSLNGEFWPPNQRLEASCKRSPGSHEPPHGACSCGIYAAKSADQLQRIGYAKRGVCGEVYLWGTVVEHELGWRAQYAYPKSLVVGPERLLCGRFVQRELSTEDLESLKILTTYGADLFVAGEKENTPWWTQSKGFDRRELAARHVVTVRVAVLMEDLRQQRLLQDGMEINHSTEIAFSDAQFPLSLTDPILHQLQHRLARVIVIDIDRTKFQVALHVIQLIRRVAGHIAVFVKSDVVNDVARQRVAEASRFMAEAHTGPPDGWLSSNESDDVLRAFNSLPRNKHWGHRPPTGEANPPGVPVYSPRNQGPRSLPPRMLSPADEAYGLPEDPGNWLRENAVWAALSSNSLNSLPRNGKRENRTGETPVCHYSVTNDTDQLAVK